MRKVGGKTFYVVGGGGYDDVDVTEEMDVCKNNFIVCKLNILVSEASMHSTRARIFRGAIGP